MNNKLSFYRIIAHLFLIILISTTSAQVFSESGLYFGGAAGNSTIGFQRPSTDVNVDVEESDFGYKIFGGMKFTLLAAEAGYVDFGTIKNSDVTAEVSGYTAYGILSMGLGPVEVFGKYGGFIWKSQFSDAEEIIETDGYDTSFGIGAAANFADLGVRVEYEYFDIAEYDKISMLSVGAVIWF